MKMLALVSLWLNASAALGASEARSISCYDHTKQDRQVSMALVKSKSTKRFEAWLDIQEVDYLLEYDNDRTHLKSDMICTQVGSGWEVQCTSASSSTVEFKTILSSHPDRLSMQWWDGKNFQSQSFLIDGKNTGCRFAKDQD